MAVGMLWGKGGKSHDFSVVDVAIDSIDEEPYGDDFFGIFLCSH